MDIDEGKIGEWPNVALKPGTHEHAATGGHVDQPGNTRIGRYGAACAPNAGVSRESPANAESGREDAAKRADVQAADPGRDGPWLADEWEIEGGKIVAIVKGGTRYVRERQLRDQTQSDVTGQNPSESRWRELFGSPERAARTMARMCMCAEHCEACPLFDQGLPYCERDVPDIGSIEFWLRGDA